MNNIGLILDCGLKVGSFTYFTAEDSYGKRNLKNLKIKSDYFDVIKMYTKKSLQFVYAKKVDKRTFKIIDTFGYGVISGGAFVSDNDVLLKEATFAVAPKGFQNQ